MATEVSQGKVRPRTPRREDVPTTPNTALTVADHDPKTGRFKPGNRAARRRALKRIGKQLPWLDQSKVAPWAAPYIAAAKEHAGDLLADLRGVGPLVSPIAEELATARLVYRALMQLGLAGDMDALSEARQWLREARQGALTLEAMARTQRDDSPDDNDAPWMVAATSIQAPPFQPAPRPTQGETAAASDGPTEPATENQP